MTLRLLAGSFAGVLIALAAAPLNAGEKNLDKQLVALNNLTGSGPMTGALKELMADPKQAKSLVEKGLSLAKDKKLTYNGAFILALTAADLKDMKSSEAYFRVCMDQAAKLQSLKRLMQSYGGLIELYYDAKQYEDSARVCKELLNLKTDDGKPRIVYRTISDRSGEIDFIEDDSFDTSKRLKPTVQQTLIKAITKQGKFDQAIKLVDSMLMDQDHWLERQLKGWVLREAGKPDEAATIYEEVIKKVTGDREIDREERDYYIDRYRYELSNIYVDLKNIDKAAEHLETLIKKNPEEPGYQNDLGYILADHDRRIEEAEKLVRNALELDKKRRQKSPSFDPATDKENGAYLDSLAWIYFKQKKHKEAKEVLLKAVEDKASQHLEIYDHLADVHMALGEREQAIQAWQKGLEFVTETRRDQDRKKLVEEKLSKAKMK